MTKVAARVWALAAVAVVLGFYGWTVCSSDAFSPAVGVVPDYDNALAHSLLNGHLYLDLPVDPSVMRARDPYDFGAVPADRLRIDSTYYRGRYYLYFGVVPPVLMLLPYRLLTGHDLPLATAVVLLATAAFLAMAALWWRLCSRFFPRQANWAGGCGILLVGLSGGLLVEVRRPWVYEFAIAGGVLFLALLLHCLVSALLGRRPAASLALAGLCLGLAVGSRPNLLLAGLAPVFVLLWLWRRDRRLGPAVGFAAAFGVLFALLLAYNAARFGSPFEFGFKYQLTSPKASDRHFLGLHYAWFNFQSYFCNRLEWSRLYPFYETVEVGHRPPHYYLSEWVYGLLRYAPALWFVPGIFFLARDRRILAVVLAGAWLGPLAFDLVIESSALRYTADFAPLLLLTGGLGALALAERWRRPWPFLFAAAVVSGALVAAVHSLQPYGVIVQKRGVPYTQHLARTLNLPAFWYERLRGWHYGSVSLTATPAGSSHGEQKLVGTPACSLVTEHLVADRTERFGLRFGPGDDVVWSPPLPVATHSIDVAFGALFPEVEHPYYDKHPYNPDNAGAYQVNVDGQPLIQGYRLLTPIDCRDIAIAGAEARRDRGWFTGRVTDVRRNRFIATPDLNSDFEPWTLSLRVPKTGARRLWSADGPAGRDEFQLVVEPSANRAHYRYLPAGGAALDSPSFACAPGQPLRLVVGAEDLAPTHAAAGTLRLIWIEQDGRLLWQSSVAGSGAGPECVALGNGVKREPTAPVRQPRRCDEPLLLRFTLPTQQYILEHDPILMLGPPGDADGITIIYNTLRTVRFSYDHWGLGGVAESELVDASPAEPHEVEVCARPTGDGQGNVQLTFDGRRIMNASVPMYPETDRPAHVGVNPSRMTGEPRLSGSLLLARWLE